MQRRRSGGGRDCQSHDSDEDSVICVGEDEQKKSATETHRRGGERHKPAGRDRTNLKRSFAGDDAILIDSASEGESSPGRERGCQATTQVRKTGGRACARPQWSPTVPARHGAGGTGGRGRGPSHFRERLAQDGRKWDWLGWGGGEGGGGGGVRGGLCRDEDQVDFGQWDDHSRVRRAAAEVIDLFFYATFMLETTFPMRDDGTHARCLALSRRRA